MTAPTPDDRADPSPAAAATLRTVALTTAELRLVAQSRADAEARVNGTGYRIHLLDVAHRWAEWLAEHNRGPSFSTFVNEFGYDAGAPAETYRDVDALLGWLDQRCPNPRPDLEAVLCRLAHE